MKKEIIDCSKQIKAYSGKVRRLHMDATVSIFGTESLDNLVFNILSEKKFNDLYNEESDEDDGEIIGVCHPETLAVKITSRSRPKIEVVKNNAISWYQIMVKEGPMDTALMILAHETYHSKYQHSNELINETIAYLGEAVYKDFYESDPRYKIKISKSREEDPESKLHSKAKELSHNVINAYNKNYLQVLNFLLHSKKKEIAEVGKVSYDNFWLKC